MENTVIGVYDSYSQAQNAMNEIVAAGISRSNVRLNPEQETGTTDMQTGQAHEDRGSAIGNFFRSLFGMGDEDRNDSDIYAEAVRRGSCVLTVDADTDEQRDTVMTIMNRYDPVDIEERSAHWRSQGWTGYDATAPWLTEDQIREDRSRYAQASDTGMYQQRDVAAEQQDMARQQGTQQATSPQTTQQATTQQGMQQARSGQDTGGEGARIPVVEEQLKVGKREVQRGGVRVLQRVRETPVHESVDLRQEHVKVERHPVDQPASAADMAAFKEGEVEMREMAEEPVVEKVARVVEEVVVGKEVSQEKKDIDDTVRRTDVEVQNLSEQGRTTAGMQAASPDMGSPAGMNETGTTGTTGSLAQDDAEFRRHWQGTYAHSGGRYEDYDAAYRYGYTTAGSDRFKNYRWDDAEPQMRQDWEAQHPESAWDKVKDAVRYGAERVKNTMRH